MTQPELMRQIADAMERNPEGWWKEFEWVSIHGYVMDPSDSDNLFNAICMGREVRVKPITYTLHIEGMPESKYSHVFPANDPRTHSVYVHLRYPDEPTAREALEKLTRAMGGNDD